MPKKKMVPKDEAEKEIVRVAFRFHGPELEKIREIRDMLNLNSEVDAARYLMQRGLEAMTPTLMSRRVQVQMAKQANPEEILKKLAEQGIYEAPPKVYVEPPKCVRLKNHQGAPAFLPRDKPLKGLPSPSEHWNGLSLTVNRSEEHTSELQSP